MLEKDGDVMTKVVPNRHSVTLVKEVRENVLKDTEVHTDEARQYDYLQGHYTHKRVNHSAKQYVGKDGQTTNSIEGFFFHLKRTIKGTHIWVSAKHLHKYTGEAEFMYNRRNRPLTMLPELLSVFPKQSENIN